MTEDEEKQQLIAALRALAAQTGGVSVPRHRFLKEAGTNEYRLKVLFGSYNEFIAQAGLHPNRSPTSGQRYSDEELLREVARVLRLPAAKPSAFWFDQHSAISNTTCLHRFGGWLGTLKRVMDVLDSSKDADLRETLSAYIGAQERRKLSTSTVQGPESQQAEEEVLLPTSPRTASASRHLYGERIDFRGLHHAPVNEQGVVFLFGMVARELGYVVESLRPDFPDCEAKRLVARQPERWQRVQIEFEFRSRSFRDHGHDPKRCDLIVCWEHDWPECPVEVLVLKEAIRSLRAS